MPHYSNFALLGRSVCSFVPLDDLPNEILLHILRFLCPVYRDIQSLDEFDGVMDYWNPTIPQILRWPREALAIALTCNRMHHMLFLDTNNDALFWQSYCFTFMRRIALKDAPNDTDRIDTEDGILRHHAIVTWPTNSYGRTDFTKRGIIHVTSFYIPEDQRHIAAVGSDEQLEQPNYYRLLTVKHHRMREDLRQDLQQQADDRYRMDVGERLIDNRIKKPVLWVLYTAIFINCILFYGLQTLHGFLHWLLVDIFHLVWYELPSRILLHVSWLPAWIVVILLFSLTTSMALYSIICRLLGSSRAF